MKLTQLTLQGFKSFGDRVNIEFSPGITAVVGPNGSGKSNVIDGLKWATGGGRASAYRASEQTDLIFHGAAGKKSVSFAEVELEMAGSSRSWKVYRSLHRDGTTRLRLNGRAARFLDIDEALAGTGFGRSGLAIVGQGEVSQVLMADPERLLDYIAEAAGVSRLSGRREQAEARLRSARANLDRLADVMSDITEQVKRLETEANDARRHANLASRALELRYTAATRRLENQQQAQRAATTELAKLEDELRENRFAAMQAEEQLAHAVIAVRTAERALREAAAQLEAARGELNVARERLARLRDQEEQYAKALAQLASEQQQLSALTKPTPPELSTTDLQAELNRRQAALTAAQQAHATHESAVRELRKQVAHLSAEQQKISHQQAQYESRTETLAQEIKAAQAGLAALTSVDSTALEAAQAAYQAAEARVVELEAEREAHSAALREQHETHAKLVAELRAEERNVERLTAAFEARSGYQQGPRAALTSGIPGVLGSVAEVFSVDPAYTEAIAALLGRRGEYVLVDTAQTGVAVLAHVKQHGGYVTVLPLDVMSRRETGVPALAREPGVLTLARDQVSTDAKFTAVKHQLLGDSVIVESVERAATLAKQHSHRPRMVSVTGELVEPSGAMSGGRRQRGPNVLGAAADLEAATTHAAQIAEREAAARAALHELQARDQVLRGHLEAARDEQTRTRKALRELETEHAHGTGAQNELTNRIATLQKQQSELRAPSAPNVLVDGPNGPEQLPLASAVTQVASDLARAETELAAHSAAVQHARDAVHNAQTDERFAAEQWRHYREASERYEAGQQRLATLHSEQQALTEQHREAVAAVTAAAERAETLHRAVPESVAAEEAAVENAELQRESLEKRVKTLAEQREALGEQLEHVRLSAARRDTAIELAKEDLREVPAGVQLLDLTERAARIQLNEVEAELAEIGPVNQRAERDLAELTERHEDIQVETVQATLAVTELEAALTRIDRETNQRLGAAVSRVQHNFTEQIGLLFGQNGQGGIDPVMEEGRLTGVRIRLQPPGKQTESLHLLSVGERTMGALAFLFALMSGEAGSERLPIAVLDEVDAPLDEANIRRFCSFVSQLAAQGTQFILITHQKATFEIADILWGVTTEAGVSRVFSVAKSEEAHRVASTS